ncbi:MAG: DNA repair exonuclease [Chthonomonadales bacterium]|nr:DNA repair exonuclease [Chthonomonadales bacterium]
MLELLCAADLHLGRRPARLPPVDAGEHSAGAVWETAVEHAVRRGVAGVLLAGDVVDRANCFFEAFGPLERGARRLASAGIPLFAVTGNHDFDVLPRLADHVPAGAFHLLGTGGAWEERTLAVGGIPALRLAGWSFPAEHVRYSPLDAYRPEMSPGNLPVVGLLHCDLDVPGSVYGPVTGASLRGAGPSAWVTGHVHRSRLETGSGALLLNPGSPQPLDPGEAGPHGVWVLRLKRGAPLSAEMLPIATVRYDSIAVDLDGALDAVDVRSRVLVGVRDHIDAVRGEGHTPVHLCCRVTLIGRCEVRGLRSLCREMASDTEVTEHAGVRARIDDIALSTRPPVELAALAQGADAPAQLARLLLALESGAAHALAAEALEAARRCHESVWWSGPFQAVANDPLPGGEVAREDVLRGCRALLEALLAQREQA